MAKLILLMHVSLDGYMAGPNGEMDWIIFDDELNNHVTTIWKNAGGTIYGRTTYQIMENYWPGVLAKPDSNKSQFSYAQWVDQALKVVVSTTLPDVSWNNTTLIKSNVVEEISRIKKQEEKDLLLIGSAGLTHSLLATGLIDEYRINVNPVVLGNGIPLFKNISNRTNLKLKEAKHFNSGVVGLHYEAKGE
jgi:dihydrofolate reductase